MHCTKHFSHSGYWHRDHGMPKKNLNFIDEMIMNKNYIHVQSTLPFYNEDGFYLVPGSHKVLESIKNEGLLNILNESGFKLREPGCSACLAMNDDKIPPGKYAVSTSNRNFEGRQGPGARTLLASPIVAAAAAITGKVTDPRSFI